MYTETSLKPWVALPGELNLSHLILKFIIVIFYILYIFLIFKIYFLFPHSNVPTIQGKIQHLCPLKFMLSAS